MPKRNEPVKQITVPLKVHERFMAYKEYNENKEGILTKLMDIADKYKRFSAHHAKKEQSNGK